MWEVPRDSIELVTTIAFGTMGPVWKAKAWDITDSADGVTSVAIKTLNGKNGNGKRGIVWVSRYRGICYGTGFLWVTNRYGNRPTK